MKIRTITKASVSFLLLLVLSSCTEDPLDKSLATGGGGHTLTLTLSVNVSPIPETKATVCAARPGSEAAKAGFSYELVSTDTDSTSAPVVTKAPSALKNFYALLFTSSGAYNGCARLDRTVTSGATNDITFSGVTTTTAAGCRLVVVANDVNILNDYSGVGGTGTFSGFTGTYAAFQQLVLTSDLTWDSDVPYVGDATVDLAAGELGKIVSVSLYRMLAKVTINNTFSITGGPSRTNIELCNGGSRNFAPEGNNGYSGTGSTSTTHFHKETLSGNSNSLTFYVGENIRPFAPTIYSIADRNSKNAPTNASYIRITSGGISGANTNPKIGEEYFTSGTKSFTYDIYLGKSSDLSDFSLRRNTNYTITSTVSGTMATQEELAGIDGRVTLTKTAGESAGLVIGRFGGPSGYSAGSGTDAAQISGSYTKLLLLQPNTSGSTATDNVTKVWRTATAIAQPELRRHWDKNYIYNLTIDGSVGGMNPNLGYLYDYCYQLTLGNVAKGTWYVPTHAQLMAIWLVYEGLKTGGFERYAAFSNSYWSCTSENTTLAWSIYFNNGTTGYNTSSMSKAYSVRCVRDL